MGSGTGFVLAIAALSGCGDGVVVTADSAAPSAPREVVSAAPPEETQAEWLTRHAHRVVAECPWQGERGIGDCPALDALTHELLIGPSWYEAGTAMLSDPRPAARYIGLTLVRQGMSQRPSVPPATQLALVKAAHAETDPALDIGLAIDAASMSSKVDLVREPMESFVRTGPRHLRAVALMNLTGGDEDPAWVEALVAEALKDKDAGLRTAALIGMTDRRREGRHKEVCRLLREALGDEAVEVRSAARLAIFGDRSSYVEDPKRGRIFARVWSVGRSCEDADVDAAYVSHEKDVREKTLSPQAVAEFYESALGDGRFSAKNLAGKQKQRRDKAVNELTAIAKDAAAPQAARLGAIKGLRSKGAGDTQSVLAELAKDSDEAVAKAASAPR